MKKLILLPAIVICCAMTLFSQHAEHDTISKQKPCCKMDCCAMHQGKMMQCKMSGEMTPMEKDMMMKDSTIVKTDGTVIKNNGETMKMKEGMCCDMMGAMHECGKTGKKCKHHGAYTCPMHPKETCDQACKCPKCGMMMEEKK